MYTFRLDVKPPRSVFRYVSRYVIERNVMKEVIECALSGDAPGRPTAGIPGPACVRRARVTVAPGLRAGLRAYADDVVRFAEVATRRTATPLLSQKANVAPILSLRTGLTGIVDLIKPPMAASMDHWCR